MAQGLQVFNSSGVLTVDITTRLTRITGSGTTVSNTAGSMVIQGVEYATPFFVVLTTPHYPYNSVNTTSIPTFTLSGTTLSWTAAQGTASFMVGGY